MLDSCKMVEKQSEVFYTFLWYFFQVWNRILLHIVLLKCRHVQIAFLKFTSCDNQAFVGCIPIAAVATTILNTCTKKSLETYWRHHVIYLYCIVWFSLVRFLWHTKHCRLFKTKSIFVYINRSISNNSVLYKYSFCFHKVLCQNSSIQTI